MRDGRDRGSALSGNPALLLVAVVAVVGAALGGMAVAENGPPSATEILNDTRDRYASAGTVVGSATVTASNGSAYGSLALSFALADDNQSRVSMTARNRTVVVGSNGSVAWVHDERTGLTRVRAIPAYNGSGNATAWNGSPANLSDAVSAQNWTGGHWNESHGEWTGSALRALAWDWTSENTTAERVRTATVNGTETHVIRIDPDDEQRNGTVTLWIATGNATLLKGEVTAGEWTTTVTFEDVRFNVSVADSTFEPPGIAPPEGATVVESFEELNESTAFDVPTLPEAYEFETGSTLAYGNATAAIGGYTGPANVTLLTGTAGELPVMEDGFAERGNGTTVELAGVNATVAETDQGVVVSWTADDLRYAVLSDGSRKRAISLAKGVIDRAD